MSNTETAESIEKKVEEIEVTGEPERIKKIGKKIMDEAEERARSILREAEKSRKEVIEEKRKEGEREAEKIIKSGTEEADSLKMQKTAEVRLKAKQMLMASKEGLISEIIDKSKERLLELTTSKGYSEALKKLIEEGGIGLGGGDLEVALPEKGAGLGIDMNDIAKRVEKETGKETTIKPARDRLRSIGGVVIRKTDGSIMIDNTYEARIDRAIRDIRIRVARLLFE